MSHELSHEPCHGPCAMSQPSDVTYFPLLTSVDVVKLARKFELPQLERICESILKQGVIPPTSFHTDLGWALNNKLFSDVTFVVQEKVVFAHRAVVSTRCAYFKSMLLSGFKEAEEGRIRLDDIDYDLFWAVSGPSLYNPRPF